MTDPITKAVRDALPAPLLSQAQCHRVVVAVLRAVREPTEGQLDACAAKMRGLTFSDYPRKQDATLYAAMIDTLISELEKEPAE